MSVLVGVVWNGKQADKLPVLYECLANLRVSADSVCVADDSESSHYADEFRGRGYEVIRFDSCGLKTIQEKTVAGRNLLRHYFIENTQCSHIFWLDGDVSCPPETIRVLSDARLDNVSAVRPQHGSIPGVFPFRWDLDKELYGKYSLPNFMVVGWEWLCPSRLAEVSCYGFGCNLISRRATESCEFWCKPYSPATEDILYCMDLRLQGFPSYILTGLLCAHYYGELKRPDERFDCGGDWSNLERFRRHTKQWQKSH
jgi:hypothetical protein